MKRQIIIILLLCLLCSRFSAASDFSEKETAIIYTNAIKVLEDYNSILNQIGESVVKDVEKAKSNGESFLELFVNRQVMIYNDLDPAHKLSEFYEAETYINSLLLWYPDGIAINLELSNARVSEILTHEENVYSLDIMVKKTIDGNYNNQTVNRNAEELTFRIAFRLENKSPSKFRIVGIRNAASNYIVDLSRALKEVNSEEFTPVDLLKVQSELRIVLQDYTQMLALIGDPQEPAEDKVHYKESFAGLFKEPSIRLYNDIVPEAQTALITVADYIESFISEYPEGIKNLAINADSARFGKVIKADDGSYYTYTRVNKFFSGNYKGKTAFRHMFPLTFRISFSAAGKTYSGFKITGIDIASVEYYEAANGATEVSKPQIVISPVSRKGFAVTLSGSYGQTSINDMDIKTLSLAENAHNWSVTPLAGFKAAMGVSYFLNDNVSVRTGLELNKYSSNFALHGTFTSKDTYVNVNGSTFHKIIQATYDSLVTMNFITMPLLASYTSGKPGQIGFFGEGGIMVSVSRKAEFSKKGSYSYYGYYPDEVPALQFIYIKQFGYYSREDIEETMDIRIKGLNLALYGSAGINIPLGYYSSVTAGPEIILGVSDILRDKGTYTDIFGKSYSHQPTRIRNIGFRISLNYKL